MSKVLFTQKGPEKIKYGENFKIYIKVQNELDDKIVNVNIISQQYNQHIDEIESNRTKILNFNVCCPSKQSLKEDFGEDTIISNNLNFNKLILTFEYKEDSYKVESNELNINIY